MPQIIWCRERGWVFHISDRRRVDLDFAAHYAEAAAETVTLVRHFEDAALTKNLLEPVRDPKIALTLICTTSSLYYTF
jgi:hypothetical protein